MACQPAGRYQTPGRSGGRYHRCAVEVDALGFETSADREGSPHLLRRTEFQRPTAQPLEYPPALSLGELPRLQRGTGHSALRGTKRSAPSSTATVIRASGSPLPESRSWYESPSAKHLLPWPHTVGSVSESDEGSDTCEWLPQ